MVVYPDAVWYGRVKMEDVEEIVESHILRGQPVARLILPEECLNTPSCAHRDPKPREEKKQEEELREKQGQQAG